MESRLNKLAIPRNEIVPISTKEGVRAAAANNDVVTGPAIDKIVAMKLAGERIVVAEYAVPRAA